MSTKVPPAIPETFIAMELAYGSDPRLSQIAAFCGYPGMGEAFDEFRDSYRHASDKARIRAAAAESRFSTEERLQVSLFIGAYVKWKNPHEAAALEDEHLDKQPRYNPLA